MGIFATWINGRRANQHRRAAEIAAINANSALLQYRQLRESALSVWSSHRAWYEESNRQRGWAMYYNSRNGFVTPPADAVAEVQRIPSESSPKKVLRNTNGRFKRVTPQPEPNRGGLSVQEMSERFSGSEPTQWFSGKYNEEISTQRREVSDGPVSCINADHFKSGLHPGKPYDLRCKYHIDADFHKDWG